jgi:hypothetical protein
MTKGRMHEKLGILLHQRVWEPLERRGAYRIDRADAGPA